MDTLGQKMFQSRSDWSTVDESLRDSNGPINERMIKETHWVGEGVGSLFQAAHAAAHSTNRPSA